MSIVSKLDALRVAANAVTGKHASDLTEAIQDLKDGYGGGGKPHSNFYPHNIPHNLNMAKYEYEEVK